MNVKPPHVSSTHPLGPIRGESPSIQEYSNPGIQRDRSLREFASSSSLYPRVPSVHSQPSGLSFAQQLYACSVRAAGNSSLHSSTPESIIFRSSLPTPPNSPPNAIVQPVPVFKPTLPPSVISSSTSPIDSDASEFYGTSLSSYDRRHEVHASSSSRGNVATHGSMDRVSPHRSQSHQFTMSPIQQSFLPHPHRASTFSGGNSKQDGIPTLVTTARPPTNLSSPTFQTLPASPPPPHLRTSVPAVSTLSLPSLSPLTLNSLSTALFHAEAHPFSQTPLPPTPITAQFTQPGQGQSQVPPSTQPSNVNETNATIKQIGLAVGKSTCKFALNIAGGAVRSSLGLPQISGSVGGAIGNALANSTLDGDSMGSLASGLLSLGDQGTGFDTSQIQEGQPEGDYQSVIDTLTHQQQQAPVAQGVNSQALINQLQHVQSLVSTQQQQPAASLQLPIQNNHHAVYHHQQQQQQMQVAYSRPSSQHPVFQQTRPPAGPPAKQGPFGLNILLTGPSYVLSGFADSANNDNVAGGGDCYVPDTSSGTYDSFTGMGSDATLDPSYT